MQLCRRILIILAAAATSAVFATTPVDSAENTIAEQDSVVQTDSLVQKTPDLGILLIETTPDGADIVVDGVAAGTTPSSVDSLLAGPHRIELRKKGYYGKAATVKVLAGQTERVHFELVRPARLFVNSSPEGAAVALTGAGSGVTPFLLDQLKPGSYQTNLTLEGYTALDTLLAVGAGAQDTLFVALERTAAYTDSIAVVRKVAEEQKRRKSGLVSLGAFVAFTVIILIVELSR